MVVIYPLHRMSGGEAALYHRWAGKFDRVAYPDPRTEISPLVAVTVAACQLELPTDRRIDRVEFCEKMR